MDHAVRQQWLLALCTVKGINWSFLAREAQRPNGLESLIAGEVIEQSDVAMAARDLLSAAFAHSEVLHERVDRELVIAAKHGARLVTVLDDDYPMNLRLVYNLPPFLFVRGEIRVDDARSVAVVGTRKASDEGLAKTRRMASLLSEAGVTVVSGLAAGIDTAAHEATIDAGGRTIAVLGTGISRTYPSDNAALAEMIVERGALVSQFWPSTSPSSYTFPRRNVVTSGVSQGTVVVEATRTSGAKMQARLALEHGKRVFLLKSLVTDQEWARRYLDRGAIEVATVDDVVAQLRAPAGVRELVDGRREVVQLRLEIA